MNREEKFHILKSNSKKFTYAEIEQMMDEELEKDVSEMDTDFIDLCANILCRAIDENKEEELNSSPKNNKRIKFRLAKIASIVAVFSIIFGTAVTVSAKYLNNDTSDKIVMFCEDHFSIDLGNVDTDADKHSDGNIDLIADLKEKGFDDVILPSAFFEDDYTYTIDVNETDDYTKALIDLKNNNEIIGLTITASKNDNIIFNKDINITATHNSAKQLKLNGMDIFVFGNKDSSIITYVDVNIEYKFTLNNYDFDSAVKIAESIK